MSLKTAVVRRASPTHQNEDQKKSVQVMDMYMNTVSTCTCMSRGGSLSAMIIKLLQLNHHHHHHQQ